MNLSDTLYVYFDYAGASGPDEVRNYLDQHEELHEKNGERPYFLDREGTLSEIWKAFEGCDTVAGNDAFLSALCDPDSSHIILADEGAYFISTKDLGKVVVKSSGERAEFQYDLGKCDIGGDLYKLVGTARIAVSNEIDGRLLVINGKGQTAWFVGDLDACADSVECLKTILADGAAEDVMVVIGTDIARELARSPAPAV